ncbi:hypothetical protein MTO96_018423 [Rhipicephalus appendiculatus]
MRCYYFPLRSLRCCEHRREPPGIERGGQAVPVAEVLRAAARPPWMGLSAHGFATAAMVLELRSYYNRQPLAKALGTDTVALQLVVQALAAAPFASVVQHLCRRR